MTLIIRDRETKHLASEVAFLMGETETAAIQLALRDTFDRLTREGGSRSRRPGDLQRFLETEIWPQVPAAAKDEP